MELTSNSNKQMISNETPVKHLATLDSHLDRYIRTNLTASYSYQ